MKKFKRISIIWFVITVFVIFLTFFQLPLYVSFPGMATELAPIVNVEGGNTESGSFSLTTVRIGKANVFQYAWAKVNDYYEIYPEKYIRPEGETENEYLFRQLQLMENSKEQAIIVAYQKANKDIEVQANGAYVMGVVEGMPAEHVLQVGDLLYGVDDQEMKSSEEFIQYISNKKEEEIVTLKLERNKEKMEVQVPLALFPEETNKVGLGIILATDRIVKTNPPVEIHTEKIGGPSAGLMFSLEIYNQLTDEDLTKGYKIAGTGTIDQDGNVGRIGGIQQKIVAANESDVEIFFAPNEKGVTKFNDDGELILTNYEEALQTATDIKSDMKIVPVDTFDEAIEFLEALPPKAV